jgi:hypothetical protein
MGPDEKQESEIHLRKEYSTCDWIMEGLLERAGFMIKKDDYTDGFLAMYLCTRKVI